MLTTSKTTRIYDLYRTRHYEMIHNKKPNLQNAHEWEMDVYVKIKQDDKLLSRAKKAKWIGHPAHSVSIATINKTAGLHFFPLQSSPTITLFWNPRSYD